MTRYLVRRDSETILQYGILRRTGAVIQQFQGLDLPESCIVLDIGTADGLVLRSFVEYYRLNRGVGIDIRPGYLKAARENVPHAVQADGRRLPFCDIASMSLSRQRHSNTLGVWRILLRNVTAFSSRVANWSSLILRLLAFI